MSRIFILPSFERSVKKLARQERRKLADSLEDLNKFLLTGGLPAGLGFKKIDSDKYEFRVDIRLRVIVKIKDSDYYLVLAGSHEQISRYLRRFRN